MSERMEESERRIKADLLKICWDNRDIEMETALNIRSDIYDYMEKRQPATQALSDALTWFVSFVKENDLVNKIPQEIKILTTCALDSESF